MQEGTERLTLSKDELSLIGTYLTQFEKDTRFLDDHRQIWTGQHPDQWAVVYEERLVGCASTLEEAIQMAEEKGLPCHRLAVDYLPSEPVKMILPGIS